MDWTTPLKAQQTDFIQRLKSSDFLHCDKQGQHSELTVISGERLKQLRDFCWEMVRKYKPNDPKNYFINNMKGKLGEEVVKTRLGNFVTEVDYEKRVGGDGKIDFTLTSDSEVGIQVKARNGKFDEIKWTISQEEIEKNAVLVCILIQEEVSEAQTEYNLILAGFLPTNMIKSVNGKALVGINELLYSGGLRCYLESLASSEADEYMRLGNECLDREDYRGAVSYYSQVLQLKQNHVDAYNERGRAIYYLGDKQGAIEDFTHAINIYPNFANAYRCRGIVRSELGDKQGAIDDFNKAIKIQPNFALAYKNRGNIRSKLGDKQGAIDDFTRAINIYPNFALAYKNRGKVRSALGDEQSAIKDLQKAADIYKREGKEKEYQDTEIEILKLLF